MIFKSRKSLWIGIILGAIGLLLISILITTLLQNDKHWLTLLPIFAVLLFLIWIWFGTFYQIVEGQLKYKTAFIKGSIKILDIKEIRVGKTQFVGLKPALASKGLVIKYNRWDDIYISPEKESLFLEELLKVNPRIEIVGSK